MTSIRLVFMVGLISTLSACTVSGHRVEVSANSKANAKDSFNAGRPGSERHQSQHHQYSSPYPYIQEELRPWGMAQSYTRVLRKSQAVRGAVLVDDPFYGVSAFSFVSCATVDLVGSDGLGLYSIAQPVCTMTTSTLSELDIYPR